MVVLLEPVCHTWMHEEANAGFLKLVRDVCTDDIVYVGEKEHLRCISKLYVAPKIRYEQIKKFNISNTPDDYTLTMYYLQMICFTLQKYHPKSLFILCAYRPCILAVRMAVMIYKQCSIYVVLHAMVEESVGNTTSYRKLLQMNSKCKNVRFISYSPFCTADYWKIPENKMIFLHLPYVEVPKEKTKSRVLNKIIIGVIGACANGNARNFIKYFGKQTLNNNYEFWVSSRFGKEFMGLPNTRVLHQSFDRECMNQLMEQMDYILLPYGKKDYEISASGVLWDAASNNVPCITLDSKYLEYYASNNIGYHAKSIFELTEIMRERIVVSNSCDKIYYTGLDKLKDYNQKIMRNLLN